MIRFLLGALLLASPASALEMKTGKSDSEVESIVASTGFTSSVTHQQRVAFASGTAVNPAIVLEDDTGTGWYRGGSNQWTFAVNGAADWEFGDGVIRSYNLVGGPAILNETAAFSNPNIVPRRDNDNTGLGSTGANQLALITNSGMRQWIGADGSTVFTSSVTVQGAIASGKDTQNPTVGYYRFSDSDTGDSFLTFSTAVFMAAGSTVSLNGLVGSNHTGVWYIDYVSAADCFAASAVKGGVEAVLEVYDPDNCLAQNPGGSEYAIYHTGNSPSSDVYVLHNLSGTGEMVGLTYRGAP